VLFVVNSRKLAEADSVAPSSTTASDEKPSNHYNSASYEIIHGAKGRFIDKFHEGIEKASSELCRTSLYSEQTYSKLLISRRPIRHNLLRASRQKRIYGCSRYPLLIFHSAQIRMIYGGTDL
jgi:hypothetical protein